MSTPPRKPDAMGSTVFERQPPEASVVEHSLARTRQSIFWLDTMIKPAPRPRLKGTRQADLVVVGGGYCGLWTAILAKQRDPDASVVVLEAVSTGWAASGRNGGFCESSLTHGYDNGLARWPEEIDDLERLGMANLDEIEQSLTQWALDAEFERVGALAVATEPHQLPWLDEERHRPDVVLMDREQIQATVASPTYLGATWATRNCALVHPGKLALGLAAHAEEVGVEIFEHSVVRGLETSGAGVEVRTDDGRVQAGRVALATNAFPSLLRRTALNTVPVYDYALLTEPLSAEQMASVGWRDRQGISDVANNFHYYRLTADNRILWGGYDAVYHFGRKVKAQYERRQKLFSKLASHFFTTFPQLAGLGFTHKWAGAIDSSTRFCAFYGLARGGSVAYSAGFTGLGVGATRFSANVMLDLLEGVETERTSLRMVRERPIPFPPEPFAAIGINATRWSMQAADRNGGRRNLFLKGLDRLGLGFDS